MEAVSLHVFENLRGKLGIVLHPDMAVFSVFCLLMGQS